MVFQKGKSGNPAGRPRSEQTITTVLRKLLLEKEGESGETRAHHVAMSLYKLAVQGDVNAIKTVLERIDGKVTEQIDVTSGGEVFSFNIARAVRDSDASDGD